MNLAEFLSENGVPFARAGEHHHVTRRFLGVDCPRCSPGSGRFRLGLRLDLRQAVCWVCGSVRIGDALAEVTGLPLPEVLDWMRLAEKGLSSPSKETSRGSRVKLPRGLEALGRAHRAFLRGRGFEAEEIERVWGIRGLGMDADLSWRIWIPVNDRNGRLASWTTRAIGTRGRRYISARPEEERVPLKSLLYGEDLAGDRIVVVEGPTDAWAIGPGAVATFGLSYTDEQVAAVARHPTRAVCFDAEPGARLAAERLIRRLEGLPGRTEIIELETGKDPASIDPGELEELKNWVRGKVKS